MSKSKKLNHWVGEYKFALNSQFKIVTHLLILGYKNWDLELFLQSTTCFRSGLLGVKLGVRYLHAEGLLVLFFGLVTHEEMKVAEEALELVAGGGGGLSPQGPAWLLRRRISLPRHDLLGEERWPNSQRRRAKSLFLNGLLLGSFCTGIQVKLINHCQAVEIKQ